MRRLSPRKSLTRGMTLVELMVGLAVMAVLVTAGAPYLGDVVINSRLREAGNLLLTETLMAQSEAIKRNTVVRVSVLGNAVQVLDATVSASPVELRKRIFPGNVTGPSATTAVEFDFGPEGRPAPFGTSVSVDLSATGVDCSAGKPLRCPGLRVDAGGATRLCGDKTACT